jgi:hypothetical protein
VATKVDFGFQVASQSPLHRSQSRFRFSSRILMSALLTSKVDFGFQVAFSILFYQHLKSTSVASKVRSDGTTTSQAPRLNTKLLLEISPARELHSNYYSRITSAGLTRSQARGLRTNNYSTWLIRLSYLGGYMLQEYSDDGFRGY